MDKKIDYASILSVNQGGEEDENNQEESKKSIIDTLIKDIDLKKNYNLRYNFYNNFIKMYEKNSKIIKLIYKKLNEVKEINEKEKVLYNKLKYATSLSSNTMKGGGNKNISPNDILNEKIVEIINEIKIAELKNIKNNKVLYKKLETLILDTYGNSIDKDNVNNIVKKLMKGGDGETKTIDSIISDIPQTYGSDVELVESMIKKIVSKLKEKDDEDSIIQADLKNNIDSLLKYLVENKIIKPKDGAINSEIKTADDILSKMQKSINTSLPDRSDKSDMDELNSILSKSRPQKKLERLDLKSSNSDLHDDLINAETLKSEYAKKYSDQKIEKEDENERQKKVSKDSNYTELTNDKKIYRDIVKAIQKNYEFKNLTNINNNYNINSNNNDYNNSILNFNKAIDNYNELDDDIDEKSKKRELRDIKNKLLIFENNPNNYYKNIELSFEDRFVFIITTFFIRYISLILVQWCVDINLIKSFEEGFIYYSVIYIAIFWFIVLFINIDNGFKVDYMNLNNAMNSIRSLFYYFYMGTNGITRLIVHSCIIFVLIIVPVILNIKKKNNYSEEDGEEKLDNIISYEERKKLTKSLSLFTIYLWILTSIIATKF